MVLALMLLLWIGGADAFGSCSREPAALRWSVDSSIAKQIGCFNHQFAEHHGYFESIEEFVIEANGKEELLFYDSVNPSKLLFRAPVGRSMQEFLLESKQHGWPSFRDGEVVWENIRVVKGNEVVSLDGTHLGHNLPDATGNRFCINLVTIAGQREEEEL